MFSALFVYHLSKILLL